jgi:hypothetical protein
VRLTTTAVPVPVRDVPAAWPVRVVVGVRRAMPYAAVVAGLLLIPVALPLAVATVTLGLVELFFRQFSTAWAALADDPSPPAAAAVGTALRTETTGLVTLQGVVLGLVFSFLGDGVVTPTIRVAAVALALGVLLGLLLLSMVAYGIDNLRQGRVAGQVFILSLNAAAYGLLCIGAATVFER